MSLEKSRKDESRKDESRKDESREDESREDESREETNPEDENPTRHGDRLDREFRPSSYWELDDPIQAIVADIKGVQRRRRLLEALEAGTHGDLPPELLQSSLDKEILQEWGRIHPLYMGGEYLPDDLIGETTIASVSLMSTTGDVMELRARPVPKGIGYRIVDEYDTRFWLPFDTRGKPLTVGEVIRLLDESHGMCVHCGTGIVFPVLVMNFSGGPPKGEDVAQWRRQASRFARVESRFYPELSAWYAERISRWVDAILSARLSLPAQDPQR